MKNIFLERSLRSKLLLWFLVVAIFPLLILFSFDYKSSSKIIKNDASESLKQSSYYQEAYINNWFSYRNLDILSWSNNKETLNLLNKLVTTHYSIEGKYKDYVQSDEYISTVSKNDEFLVNLSKEYDYIYDIFLIDLDGDILYTVAKEYDIGSNLFSDFFKNSRFTNSYIKTLKDSSVHFSDLEKYEPSGNINAGFITTPILDENGQIVGVFAVQIKVDKIDSLFNADLNNKYSHYIFGTDGVLRTKSSDKYKMEMYSNWKENNGSDIDEPITYINSSNEKIIGLYKNINILGVDWILVSEISESELYGSVNDNIKNGFIFLLITIVSVLFLSIFISKKLIKPIFLLSEATKKIALGDRNIKLDIRGKDEIGSLSDSFNKMIESLKDKENELQLQSKNNEQLLLELNEQKFAYDAHSIVARTDVKGNITFVNDKFVEISGYSKDELLGRNHRLLNSGIHGREFWVNMYKTIVRGDIWHNEVCNLAKDGTPYWVDTTIVPFLDEKGKPKSYIAIRTDITDRKSIEDELMKAKDIAEKSAKSKSEFLASMSHEIRTPMNGVIGMLRLLLDTNLDKTQKHQAELAKSSASALLTLIDDILDFSKIEAGKMEIEYIDFNLRDALGDFAEAMAFKAEEKGVELLLDTTNIEMSMVNGDPGRIRQILSNIVGNSVKFTNKGYILIKASLSTQENKNTRLILEMSDTGIGIPENKIPYLFDSFSQVDASTTRKYGGTGLGLAIVDKLCKLMNGTVSVISNLGYGSTFTVDIELALAKKSSLVMPHRSVEGKKILIVDNSEYFIDVMQMQLEHWGMEVHSENSAQDALRRLKEEKFNILFLDMFIKGMDANEVVEKIRSNSEYNNMKLIMMTSLKDMGNAIEYRKIGVDASFSKPVTTENLLTALDTMHKELSQEETEKEEEREKTEWTRGLNILLVEDNPTNQVVANGILGSLALEADIADNGVIALEVLNKGEKKYDLILMDCQMPEMDGYDTTRAIRSNQAGESYKDIPIIAMTANAMQGDKEKCEIAGMDDYITKPIDPKKLKETLQKWLSIKVTLEPGAEEETNSLLKENIDGKIDSDVWNEKDALIRLGGSEKLLSKIIEVFSDDVIYQKNELKAALDTEDRDKVKLHAHTIKGSASNLSAMKLQALAKSIEFDALTSDIESLRNQYDLLSQNIDELVDVLKSHSTDLPPQDKHENSITKEDLRSSLQELHVDLKSGSFIDSDEVDIFNAYFDEDVNQKIKILKSNVDNFMTDKALATIDDIISELGE